MKRSHIVLGAACATVLAVGGVGSSASASPLHASGTEHILILQSSADGPQVVVANGPIHAGGVDVTVTNNRDRFVFARGDLKIWHHAQTSHNSYDPKTCLFRFSETGIFRVLGGTGAYAGASGQGTYTLHGLEVGCSQNQPPTVFELKISASGPLSY
jgi:hypothetical protein